MTERFLIDVFDEVFVKDDLEKAILTVRAVQQLLVDEPQHSGEVEAELAKIGSALNEAARVLNCARIRFEQLSPRAKATMRSINLRFRRVLIEMVLALDGRRP